jgi:hypothetical protein
MTIPDPFPRRMSRPAVAAVPAPGPAAGSADAPATAAAPPSWRWRRAALLLSGAAQLITISALQSADPLTVTWAALLLAVAPAPLAALAAFAPARIARVAAPLAAVVLVAGIAGEITHIGLFFVPALAAMAVAAVLLRREGT